MQTLHNVGLHGIGCLRPNISTMDGWMDGWMDVTECGIIAKSLLKHTCNAIPNSLFGDYITHTRSNLPRIGTIGPSA
jgi:hypothetical protein